MAGMVLKLPRGRRTGMEALTISRKSKLEEPGTTGTDCHVVCERRRHLTADTDEFSSAVVQLRKFLWSITHRFRTSISIDGVGGGVEIERNVNLGSLSREAQ